MRVAKVVDFAVWCEQGPDAEPVDAMTVRSTSERGAVRRAMKAWGVTSADARRWGFRYRATRAEG